MHVVQCVHHAPQGVQDKSLVELAHEIARLQSQAAANKLPQDVLTGGTVTLSNIGTAGNVVVVVVVASRAL